MLALQQANLPKQIGNALCQRLSNLTHSEEISMVFALNFCLDL